MNPLAVVKRATRNREKSQAAWRSAILDARDAGCSLREIAEAAGVSHVRIVQLLRGD